MTKQSLGSPFKATDFLVAKTLFYNLLKNTKKGSLSKTTLFLKNKQILAF